MKLFLVALTVLMFNVPFGYWRGNVNKFSFQWFISIHLPIPFIIFLRIYSEIGFALYTYPVLVSAFFLGQLAGKKIYQIRAEKGLMPLTSCIIMDYYRQSK